jgi:hypothetical protein
MEGTSTEEVLLKREIEDLPVVSSLSFIHTIGRDKTGYRVNLFCDVVSSYGGCTDGSCTVKRGKIYISQTVTCDKLCVSHIIPSSTVIGTRMDKSSSKMLTSLSGGGTGVGQARFPRISRFLVFH